MVKENTIRLQKVGIFSQQMGLPVTDLLQEWFVPHGIEIFPLEDGKESKTSLDLVISSNEETDIYLLLGVSGFNFLIAIIN